MMDGRPETSDLRQRIAACATKHGFRPKELRTHRQIRIIRFLKSRYAAWKSLEAAWDAFMEDIRAN